jgi:hypothetical protein
MRMRIRSFFRARARKFGRSGRQESRHDVEKQDAALGTYNAFLIEHEDEQEREHDQTMPRKSL